MAKDITAEMDLELSKFREKLRGANTLATRYFKRQEGQAKTSGSKMGLSILSGMKIALGGQLLGLLQRLLASFPRQLKKAFDVGGLMSDLGAQIGETAGQAQVLSQAFANNKLSGEQMANSINKMQMAIVQAEDGLVTYQRGFEALGVSTEKLRQQSPADAFMTIMEAARKMNNETDRTARLREIFGRSGGLLNVLLADADAFGRARKELGGQVELLDKYGNKLDFVSDSLANAKIKGQGLFVGIAAGIVDDVIPAIEKMNGADFSALGKRLGDAIGEGITHGMAAWQEVGGIQGLADVLKTSLSLVAKVFLNTLANGFVGLGQTLANAIALGLSGVLEQVEKLFPGRLGARASDASVSLNNYTANQVPAERFDLFGEGEQRQQLLSLQRRIKERAERARQARAANPNPPNVPAGRAPGLIGDEGGSAPGSRSVASGSLAGAISLITGGPFSKLVSVSQQQTNELKSIRSELQGIKANTAAKSGPKVVMRPLQMMRNAAFV